MAPSNSACVNRPTQPWTEADLVLFMIDARAGVIPADETFASIVRQSGKPVLLVVNKAEGRAGDDWLL